MPRNKKREANAPPKFICLPAPILLNKYRITDVCFTKDKGYVLYEICAVDCHTVTTITANWYFNRPVVRITSGDDDVVIKLEWDGTEWEKI